MEKAVILLSGGLDSTVCMAVAKSRGMEVYPISFNYHQRHNIELESAKKVAEFYKIKKHLIIETNMEEIGGSALTDNDLEVPNGDFSHGAEDIPITYVPARNMIFLSYAMAYAEVIGADHVFIGVNAVDYSGYPDCRPEFISSFQKLSSKPHCKNCPKEKSFSWAINWGRPSSLLIAVTRVVPRHVGFVTAVSYGFAGLPRLVLLTRLNMKLCNKVCL